MKRESIERLLGSLLLDGTALADEIAALKQRIADLEAELAALRVEEESEP